MLRGHVDAKHVPAREVQPALEAGQPARDRQVRQDMVLTNGVWTSGPKLKKDKNNIS